MSYPTSLSPILPVDRNPVKNVMDAFDEHDKQSNRRRRIEEALEELLLDLIQANQGSAPYCDAATPGALAERLQELMEVVDGEVLQKPKGSTHGDGRVEYPSWIRSHLDMINEELRTLAGMIVWCFICVFVCSSICAVVDVVHCHRLHLLISLVFVCLFNCGRWEFSLSTPFHRLSYEFSTSISPSFIFSC